MLLVDHDQRQIRHRRKDRRTRAYHNVGLAVANVLPLLGALVVAEGGMQDGDLVAEDLVKIGGHRRSESDLRNQQNGRAPFRQHRLHGREVDGGLARAGNAVQAAWAGTFACPAAETIVVERRLLRGGKQEFQLARLHSRHAKAGGLFAQIRRCRGSPVFAGWCVEPRVRGVRRPGRWLLWLASEIVDDGLLVGVELALGLL